VSSAMSFSKSVRGPLNTVPPCSTSRALIMGSATAALICLLSFSTISGGCAPRRANSIPCTRLIARYEIAHGWNVRQCLQADRRGHCQGSYLARADVLNRCAYAGEKNLHLPAQQVGDRGTPAAIRHVRH